MGAMALAVTGSFSPPSFVPVMPSAFPTPGGGIASAADQLPKPATTLARLENWIGGQASHWRHRLGEREALAATPSGYIAAYAPLGSWSETTTGVALIPIAGSGVTGGVIATPDVVNSCSLAPSGTFVAGSPNPEAVCVANGTDIYLIDGTSIVKTLTSGGAVGQTLNFSGGSCTTCGVVVDALSGNAVISVSTAPVSGTVFGGFQLLNLKSQALSNVIAIGPDDAIAEHFGVFPVSSGLFLTLSPTEENTGSDGEDYDIVAVAPPSGTSSGGSLNLAFLGRSALSSTAMDTAALDSTGIIYAQDEYTGNLFLADLTQATVNSSTTPPTWNAPNQIQSLSELSIGHMDGLAVAFGAHEALTEQEFGASAFGAIKLPAQAGSGTPAASDWVIGSMPNDPSGAPWSNPLDPHGLTAAFASYAVSSGSITVGPGHGFGLLMNDARTYVAVIDLDAMLAAPRQATSGTGSHTVSSSYNLVANGVVTFVKFP